MLDAVRVFSMTIVLLALPLVVQAAEVRLRWEVGGGVAKGFVMERKVGANGAYAVVGYPTTTEWVDSDIPVDNTLSLFWRVRAFNDAGVSDPSNVVRLAPPRRPLNARLVTSGASSVASTVAGKARGRK